MGEKVPITVKAIPKTLWYLVKGKALRERISLREAVIKALKGYVEPSKEK